MLYFSSLHFHCAAVGGWICCDSLKNTAKTLLGPLSTMENTTFFHPRPRSENATEKSTSFESQNPGLSNVPNGNCTHRRAAWIS
jgi:hypothetical protein